MNANIYYHPESFDLEIVAEVEKGGSYEFDTTVLFRNKQGQFFVLHDSGCSCPTPFEEYGIEDLVPVQHTDELIRYLREHSYNVSVDDELEFARHLR